MLPPPLNVPNISPLINVNLMGKELANSQLSQISNLLERKSKLTDQSSNVIVNKNMNIYHAPLPLDSNNNQVNQSITSDNSSYSISNKSPLLHQNHIQTQISKNQHQFLAQLNYLVMQKKLNSYNINTEKLMDISQMNQNSQKNIANYQVNQAEQSVSNLIEYANF